MQARARDLKKQNAALMREHRRERERGGVTGERHLQMTVETQNMQRRLLDEMARIAGLRD